MPQPQIFTELAVSKALVQLVQDTTGGSAVIAPTLGGSVPMYIFEDLVCLGLAYRCELRNHQHSSDEICAGHFWRGMEIYGAILADLNCVREKRTTQRRTRAEGAEAARL